MNRYTLTEREAFIVMSRFVWQFANCAGDGRDPCLGGIPGESGAPEVVDDTPDRAGRTPRARGPSLAMGRVIGRAVRRMIGRAAPHAGAVVT